MAKNKKETNTSEETLTRAQHIEWCKQRALELVETGDLEEAFKSMLSDLTKHPETVQHVGIHIGIQQKMSGTLNTKEALVEFINGFA